MMETWLCPTSLPSSKVQMSCMGCWTSSRNLLDQGLGRRLPQTLEKLDVVPCCSFLASSCQCCPGAAHSPHSCSS